MAVIEVHRAPGPGLLESAYEECLCHELTLRRLAFERQEPLPVESDQRRPRRGEREKRAERTCVNTTLQSATSGDRCVGTEARRATTFPTDNLETSPHTGP